jgi:hypothetical protein
MSMRWFKWMMPLMALLLGGCGDTLTTADDGATGTVASIQLIASPATIGTNPAASSTITAIVKDAANLALSDQVVSFSASSGVLVVTQATTDVSGEASATISPGTNAANRTVVVTATAGGMSASTTVTMTGSSVNISGASAAVQGVATPLTVTVRDSGGAATPGAAVAVSSANGNTLDPASLLTDNNGQGSVAFTATTGGTDTVTASALGATATHSISISTDVFTVTMAPEIAINACAPITVTWSSGGVAVTDTVTVSPTRGTLYTEALCTIPSATGQLNVVAGSGTIYIMSPNAGPTEVIATAPAVTATANSEFIATTPASLVIQASRTTLGLNDSVDLTATVRDAANNLVKGATVVFAIVTDTTGGGISPPYDTTDSMGRANTVYSSTSQSSELDGIVIRATVSGTAISDTISLTVGGSSVSISIGMATRIESPNTATYRYSGAVQVADAAGNPVAGKTVTLQLDTESYDKGSRGDIGTVKDVAISSVNAGASTFDVFVATGFLSCGNEDLNRNGIVDAPPDVDVNGNGTLEPGTPATITPSVTTDSSGNAVFDVDYPKDYADWVQVKITAAVQVSGTESSNSTRFLLPMSTADASSPPGTVSPYGTGSACSDPN